MLGAHDEATTVKPANMPIVANSFIAALALNVQHSSVSIEHGFVHHL